MSLKSTPIVIRKEIKISKYCSELDGMAWCNFLKSSKLKYKVDRELTCDVQIADLKFTFGQAMEREFFYADGKCLQNPNLPSLRQIITRLSCLLEEITNVKPEEQSNLLNEAHNLLSTLESIMSSDGPEDMLFEDEVFNAVCHRIIHQIFYSCDDIIQHMLDGHEDLLRFMVSFEFKLNSIQ